jgi:phage shock protein PspC (stress-responsive transcriptional regulator)
MNKIISVNIGGVAFNLDHDAYAALNDYLELLQRYFSKEEGGNEIIADIEARIAELLSKKADNPARVVSADDVREVVATLGTPADIAGNEVQGNDAPKPSKHLYRDVDHRVLGGVCAGAGAHLGITPIALRVALVLLAFVPYFGGMMVLAYIVMWVAVPAARTLAQKLEMSGQPVNLGSIEKNIRHQVKPSNLQQSINTFVDESGGLFMKFFGTAWRVVAVLAGVALCCAAVATMVGLVVGYFLQDFVFFHLYRYRVEGDWFPFTELVQSLVAPQPYTLLVTCAAVFVLLPLLAIMVWSVKLVRRRRLRHLPLHAALALLWIAAGATAVVVSLREARSYLFESDKVVERQAITPHTALYVLLADSAPPLANNPIFGDVYYDKEAKQFYGKPDIDFRISHDSSTYILIEKRANSSSRTAANKLAKAITIAVAQRDSALVLSSYFSIAPADSWHFQRMKIRIYHPARTKIYFKNEEIECGELD